MRVFGVRHGGAADLMDSVGERRAAPRGGEMDTLDLEIEKIEKPSGLSEKSSGLLEKIEKSSGLSEKCAVWPGVRGAARRRGRPDGLRRRTTGCPARRRDGHARSRLVVCAPRARGQGVI